MPLTDRFKQVSSTVAHSNRWLHQRALHNLFQLVPSCGLNTKRELIYTHSINNNIQSIIRSVELKTPIVSPMDCVDSPGAPHRNMLHLLAASSPMGRCFFSPFTLFTVGSFVAGVAHTIARHAQPMSTTLRIDTLWGRNVTLSALPAAVALTAPPGVLAITAAQNRTGSWGKTTDLNNSCPNVKISCR